MRVLEGAPRFLGWAAVILFAINWTYLVVVRPEFDDRGKFSDPVFTAQLLVMALTALLLLASLWPHITKSGLKVFAIGLLLDAIGSAIFMNVDHGIYFDTIGTVLVGVLLGPSAGALTAISSQAIVLFVFPAAIPFYMINMAVGWGAGVLARMGGFRTKLQALLTGTLLGVIAGIIAIPLMSLNYGSDPSQIEESPNELLAKLFGVFFGDLAHAGSTSDPLDKALVCLIVVLIIPFVNRLVRRKK